MIGAYGKLEELAGILERGEARFWVNDYGPPLIGKIQYKGTGLPTPDVEFVGIVDEEAGGMIAFGEPKLMQQLCDDLNKLWFIEELMHA